MAAGNAAANATPTGVLRMLCKAIAVSGPHVGEVLGPSASSSVPDAAAAVEQPEHASVETKKWRKPGRSGPCCAISIAGASNDQ
jgi:hypothetical protein